MAETLPGYPIKEVSPEALERLFRLYGLNREGLVAITLSSNSSIHDYAKDVTRGIFAVVRNENPEVENTLWQWSETVFVRSDQTLFRRHYQIGMGWTLNALHINDPLIFLQNIGKLSVTKLVDSLLQQDPVQNYQELEEESRRKKELPGYQTNLQTATDKAARAIAYSDFADKFRSGASDMFYTLYEVFDQPSVIPDAVHPLKTRSQNQSSIKLPLTPRIQPQTSL